MGQIKVEKNVGGIEGLCVITPAVHGDNRGYFMETYSQRDMEEAGLNIPFVQDNQSMSVKGVLRGLHFQKHYPQTEAERCRLSKEELAICLAAEAELEQEKKELKRCRSSLYSAILRFREPTGSTERMAELSKQSMADLKARLDRLIEQDELEHPEDREERQKWDDLDDEDDDETAYNL